jgi:hypothetical protein
VAGPRRLARRPRAETRELLLLAGALLADETVERTDDALLGQWLSHVRLEDVLGVAKQLQLYLAEHEGSQPGPDDDRWWVRDCRREILAIDASAYRDIAPSTAYTVFDHERDFREQLAGALLRAERLNDTSPMVAAYEQLYARYGGPPPLELMVAELARVEFERLRELDGVYVEMGAIPFSGHPLLRELLSRTLERAMDAEAEGSLAALYQALLDAYGWRMRGGVTTADLVVSLYALSEGYLFFDRLWPDGVRDDVATPTGPRSAFALAVTGVVHQFAEPDPSGSAS